MGWSNRWAVSARLWGKAASENFNPTLEWKLLPRRHLVATSQTGREVAGFIDAYNHQRRHSSCEMKPSIVYEQFLADRAAKERAARKSVIHSEPDVLRGGPIAPRRDQ